MTSEEIKSELMKLLQESDLIVEPWASAKAEHDKIKDLKKLTLAVIASDADGKSEAERERNALKTTYWMEYLNQCKEKSQEYYNLQARKDGLSEKISVYRSLLSHDKTMVGLTQ